MNFLLTLAAFLIITNGVLALMVLVTAPLASRYQKIRGKIVKDYKSMKTTPGEGNTAGLLFYGDSAYPTVDDYYKCILKIEGKNPADDHIIKMRAMGVYPPKREET